MLCLQKMLVENRKEEVSCRTTRRIIPRECGLSPGNQPVWCIEGVFFIKPGARVVTV
jgi:hypothetical protein